MKTDILTRSFLRVLVLAFLVLGSITTSAFAADIGRIKKAKGPAFVERAGERISAEPGLPIETHDVLVTEAGGRIAVTFADNSRYSVGPKSRISLDSFEFDTTSHKGVFETSVESGTVAIISGQIAKKTPDAMKVRTPTSILGVRGTRFVVEVGQ